MRFHRRVALVSAVALVGLIGFAEASNFNAPKRALKVTPAVSALREKIRNANIQGCGG